MGVRWLLLLTDGTCYSLGFSLRYYVTGYFNTFAIVCNTFVTLWIYMRMQGYDSCEGVLTGQFGTLVVASILLSIGAVTVLVVPGAMFFFVP